MDFGKILENWEKGNKSNSKSQGNARYPDKDTGDGALSKGKGRNLKVLKKIKAQDTIDLHGLTSAEAEIELKNFLLNSKNKGYTKVCVIHGKGIHSSGESVLKKMVDNVLRDCPYVGATGFSQQKDGGKGSRWVTFK